MLNFNIKPVDYSLKDDLMYKINYLTKPLGSLGKIEELAMRIGCIQNTLSPSLNKPMMILFAGDHGIVDNGITPAPQAVTYQMVYNFLRGGAGINVFTRQHGIELKVVDSGVNHDFVNAPGLIDAKIAKGTKSYLYEPAMTREQCIDALKKGCEQVEKCYEVGCNIIGFGEMGIANSSSSSLLLHKFCNIPIEDCVGRGAGLSDEGLENKRKLLKQSVENNPIDNDPISILSTFAGFEQVMMTAGMLKAAELGMIVIIDGFIATASLLGAHAIAPDILDYCVFSHTSGEGGHKLMLDFLKVEPLVNLDLRLGEGTGAAIIYPLIKSAIVMINEMATFKEAGVFSTQVDMFYEKI